MEISTIQSRDVEMNFISTRRTTSENVALGHDREEIDIELGNMHEMSIPIEDTKELNGEESLRSEGLAKRLWYIFWKRPKTPFHLDVRTLEDCEDGYPYLATFMDSSEELMIFRRFGFLHIRLLLQKQHELQELEIELDDMDKADLAKNRRALKQRIYDERRAQTGKTRKTLLAEIEKVLDKYDHLLLRSKDLVATNRPAKRDYKSVATFISCKKPLVDGEAKFIWAAEDLVTLRPGRETAWLDFFVSWVIRRLPRFPITKIFVTKESTRKTKDPALFAPERSRIEKTVNIIVVSWVVALIVVPIYALYYVGSKYDDKNAEKSKTTSMAILLVSTLVFAVILKLFTKAKRHELLAAAAAYCALLVVFIANLGMKGK